MKPTTHLFLGTLASILIYFLFNVGLVPTILFWVGSWLLIDLDHFIYTSTTENKLHPVKIIKRTFEISKTRSLLPKKTFRNTKYPLFIFHGIETLVLIYLIAQFYSITYFILYGFLFHLIFDYIDLIQKDQDILLKTSFIYVLATNKNKKRLKI